MDATTASSDDEREGGAAHDSAADKLAADDSAQPTRPGTGRWVESSWDLRRGLTVREGLPPDAGLDEWLEAMLRE